MCDRARNTYHVYELMRNREDNQSSCQLKNKVCGRSGGEIDPAT